MGATDGESGLKGMDALVHNFFNFEALWRSRLVLLEGGLGTLKLGLAALVLASLVGLLVVAADLSPWPWVRRATQWYIDLIRAIPLLVFLALTYYLLLPLVGLRVEPFPAAAVAFGLKHGAYFAEVYRGGWLSVERGQFDAAYSLGLRTWRTVQLIVIPQMARIILPALTSQITLVLRDLPLAFVIGYFEILTSARAAQVFTANSTPLVGAVVAYGTTLLFLQWLTGLIEQHSRRRAEA